MLETWLVPCTSVPRSLPLIIASGATWRGDICWASRACTTQGLRQYARVLRTCWEGVALQGRFTHGSGFLSGGLILELQWEYAFRQLVADSWSEATFTELEAYNQLVLNATSSPEARAAYRRGPFELSAPEELDSDETVVRYPASDDVLAHVAWITE